MGKGQTKPTCPLLKVRIHLRSVSFFPFKNPAYPRFEATKTYTSSSQLPPTPGSKALNAHAFRTPGLSLARRSLCGQSDPKIWAAWGWGVPKHSIGKGKHEAKLHMLVFFFPIKRGRLDQKLNKFVFFLIQGDPDFRGDNIRRFMSTSSYQAASSLPPFHIAPGRLLTSCRSTKSQVLSMSLCPSFAVWLYPWV